MTYRELHEALEYTATRVLTPIQYGGHWVIVMRWWHMDKWHIIYADSASIGRNDYFNHVRGILGRHPAFALPDRQWKFLQQNRKQSVNVALELL